MGHGERCDKLRLLSIIATWAVVVLVMPRESTVPSAQVSNMHPHGELGELFFPKKECIF